jgi:hypothetical protein
MVVSTKRYDQRGLDEEIASLHRRFGVDARKLLDTPENFRIMFGTGLSSDLASEMIMFLEHLGEHAQKDSRQPSELDDQQGTYGYR